MSTSDHATLLNGRAATAAQVAAVMQIPLDEYHHLVEDAAHAVGTRYNGEWVGARGTA